VRPDHSPADAALAAVLRATDDSVVREWLRALLQRGELVQGVVGDRQRQEAAVAEHRARTDQKATT